MLGLLVDSTYVIAEQPNGSYVLQMTGKPAQSHTLLVSTNLVDWLPLANPTAGTNGLFNVTDPDAANHLRRYYRLRTP